MIKIHISNEDQNYFVIKTEGLYNDNVSYHWNKESKDFWARYPPVLSNSPYDTSAKEMLNYFERETIGQVIDSIFKRDDQRREDDLEMEKYPPLPRRELPSLDTEDSCAFLDSIKSVRS